MEIYTDHQKSGQMQKVYGSTEKDDGVTIKEPANKDVRIRVIFYPNDASKTSQVEVVITADNVDPHVDRCMTMTECLKILDDEISFILRNDNKLQLDCLQKKTMPHKLQNKCGEWENCVSKSPKHKKDIVALLRAGVGGNGGSLNQGVVATNDTAAAAGNPNMCVDPSADDAEAWDCECLDDMVSGCEGSDSLEECLKAKMCNFDKVCAHWKKNNNCPKALIQKKSTDALAKLTRRQVNTKNAIDSELDGTVQGKCSQ